jgi:transcriptional regulator CtsR
MGISDIIADFINTSLLNSSGYCELRRSDLAERFGCVPSQINYVISTRFLPEHGYIVESRRGGGGYIRISKVSVGNQMLRMHAVNAVGDEIDSASTAAFLANLRLAGALSPEEERLIAAALGERSLREVPPDIKGQVRASILKNMLMLCSGMNG